MTSSHVKISRSAFSQSKEISSDLCCFYGGGVIHAMHNAKFALGTWKRVVKTRPVALILNLFLHVCVLFQVKIIIKSI